MPDPLILVTNDDGIDSPYLLALAKSLGEIGEAWIYAPDRNQSGVGHGISLHRPLRVTHRSERCYCIDGTPTDCVMLAVRDLLGRRPALVFSGINNGANLGDDVTYSGTVAGAFEGMLLGVPSVAMSITRHNPEHVETAAHFAQILAKHILLNGLPDDTVLNVNVPDVPWAEIRGVEITRQGRRAYSDEVIRREDPRGISYYWIGGDATDHVRAAGTDFDAIDNLKISVTPLHRDLTNYASIDTMQKRDWGLET